MRSIGGNSCLIKKNHVMVEAFMELTDQLFWAGYAKQLAEENPEQFQREYEEFFSNYDFKTNDNGTSNQLQRANQQTQFL